MKDTSEITRDVLRRRDDWQSSRRERRRRMGRCMMVLALVLTLCGAAAAAGSNVLADYFAGYHDGDLSPEQEAVASLAERFETRTAVSGDWTVTIDNAVCDGLNYYMTMSVTGPEGWMEDSGGICWYAVKPFVGGQLRPYTTMRTWHELELAEADTDYYVMCLTFPSPIEGPMALELGEMFLLRGEQKEPLEEEAVWAFEDLEFAATHGPVELLAKPVTIRTGIALDVGTCQIQLDSVQLRTFALHIAYSNKDRVGSPDLEGLLVLKDGTTYELRFSVSGDADSGELQAIFGFPVLPEEVDHILIEGIRFDIP